LVKQWKLPAGRGQPGNAGYGLDAPPYRRLRPPWSRPRQDRPLTALALVRGHTCRWWQVLGSNRRFYGPFPPDQRNDHWPGRSPLAIMWISALSAICPRRS